MDWETNKPVERKPLVFAMLRENYTDLYEDGDHCDAMRALSCLSVVGVQILVIMDQLDLTETHSDTERYKLDSSNDKNMCGIFT